MLHILQRIVCPVLLLIAGIGSLVYGTWFHRETILTEQEIEIKIPAPPPEFSTFGPGGPSGFGDPNGPGGFSGPGGFGEPGGGPPPNFGPPPDLNRAPKTIVEIIVHETHELEGNIIKEITTGSLVRTETGELKRTYLFGEKPDSLCPT